ncbi:hypothetical protein Tco_0368843, partial [Tanacetum coccineum]
MCNYIKNMGSHTLQQLKKLSFDEIKELFETTIKRVKDFVPIESDRLVPKISTGRSKENWQKQNWNMKGLEAKSSDNEDNQLKRKRQSSKKTTQINYEQDFYRGSSVYSTDPTDDKERTLWVELKRLFKPDTDEILGHDIFMLVEKDYPRTRGILTLMLEGLIQKLDDLKVNHKFRGGLLGIKGFYKFLLLVQLSTAKRRLSTAKLKIQEVTTRDEKWVPSADRVKISSTNLRLETTIVTFQVVIDIIKNSTCFKAFTISTHIPEIFMQQFWYTIKKVQGTDSYEFILANKKCRVDAEVFRKILDICPRVKGEEFTELQNDDNTLTFLIDPGYKGPLHMYTNMYVDHISQPWRTLAAIINKCLSRKTASNDILRKSRIDIMWGMLYRENVNYPELIWEDFDYQIDHMRERKSRREDYQEYRLAIPDVMLNDTIKQSESYQMFIKYSTESEPEPAKKKTASRRVVKNKVTISTDDNIIPDPNVAFELGKSISSTKAAEKEAERQVHASHERIVTESILKVSSEGTGTIPGVPDESTVVSATSSEGTDADDEDAKTKSNVDEIYKYKIHVHKDVDADMEELKNVEHENKEKDVITDAAKLDVEKHAEETRDAEKATGSKFQVKDSTEFPLPSSSLSDTAEADVPVLVILETTNLPPKPKILNETPVSTAVSSPHVIPTISIVQQTTTPICDNWALS